MPSLRGSAGFPEMEIVTDPLTFRTRALPSLPLLMSSAAETRLIPLRKSDKTARDKTVKVFIPGTIALAVVEAKQKIRLPATF